MAEFAEAALLANFAYFERSYDGLTFRFLWWEYEDRAAREKPLKPRVAQYGFISTRVQRAITPPFQIPLFDLSGGAL